MAPDTPEIPVTIQHIGPETEDIRPDQLPTKQKYEQAVSDMIAILQSGEHITTTDKAALMDCYGYTAYDAQAIIDHAHSRHGLVKRHQNGAGAAK